MGNRGFVRFTRVSISSVVLVGALGHGIATAHLECVTASS